MKQLQELHDTTLTRIELDWGNGSMRASFLNDYSHETTNIYGEGLISFSYDRKLPWGNSVCVNKVEIDQNSERAILTIEMQSGDTIVGRGTKFSVSK
jgi:hypothetical protein